MQLCICDFSLQINELNNTRKSGKELLFFNRVPKVGSQTAMELLRLLSIRNDFNFHKDRTQKVENIKLTLNEEVSTYGRLPHYEFLKYP